MPGFVGEGGPDLALCTDRLLPALALADNIDDPEDGIGGLAVNVSNRMRHPVNCIILLILPFFLPEIKSRCSLASSSWKRISWWKVWPSRDFGQQHSTCEPGDIFTNLYDPNFSYRCHTTPNVLFSTVKLETIVSEHDFRPTPGHEGQMLQKGRDLCRIYRGGGKQQVEVRWQQIELSREVMCGLQERRLATFFVASGQSTPLTSNMIARIERWMLTRSSP